LAEHVALRDGVQMAAGQSNSRRLGFSPEERASLAAVLAKGQPPQGDIWSHERGLV
jgi:hypothetical protein